MASYITNSKDSFVPTNLYTPNFDAIQGIWANKQAQYDKGFSQVKSIYNSVANSPTTKDAVKGRQIQYIKDAENALADLPKLDLSLPENQAKANSVFDKALHDDEMITDIAYTKKQRREEDFFKSFKPDDDSEEYADRRNYELMQLQKNKVKNAKTGDMDVYQTVDFVPFTDFNKLLDKAVKETGFAVKTVDNKGNIIYETTNGSKSVGNWSTFINNTLSTRYDAQFKMLGKYEKEAGIQGAKSELAANKYRLTGQVVDPNTITEQEALSYYVNSRIESMGNSYKTLANNYEQHKLEIANELKALENKVSVSGITPEDVSRKKALLETQKDIEDQINHYTNEAAKYKPKSAEFEELKNRMISNPENYFAQSHKTETVNGLANKYAANLKQEVKKNPEWEIMFAERKENFDEEAKLQELDITRRKNDIDEQKVQIDAEKARATIQVKSEGKNKVVGDDITYVGPETTHPTAKTPKELFDIKQNELFQRAVNPLLDPTTGLALIRENVKSVLPSDKNTDSDALIATTLWSDVIKGERKLSDLTPDEKELYQGVNKLLVRSGVLKLGSNLHPVEAARAVEDYYSKFFTNPDNTKDGSIYRIASQVWTESKKAREEYEANHQAKLKAEDDYIQSNKKLEKYGLVIYDPSIKKKRFKTDDELIPYIPDIESNGKKISSSELKKAIINDKIKIIPNEQALKGHWIPESIYFKVNINDKIYDLNPTTVDYLDKIQQNFEKSHGGFNRKIGGENKRLTILNNIKTVVPSNFKPEELYGNVFSLDVNKDQKVRGERPIRILQQVALPGNIEKATIIGSDGEEEIDPDAFKSMQRLLDDEDNIEKYTSGQKLITLPDGIAVEFAVSPDTPAEVIKKLGLKDTDFANKPIVVRTYINNSTKSPDLQNFINLKKSSDYYVWEDLTKKKTIRATDYEKKLGFDYSLTPTGNNIVTGIINFKTINSKGEYEQGKREVTFDLSVTNPDEIRAQIYDYRNKLFDANANTLDKLKQLQQKNTTPAQKSLIDQFNSLK